MKKHRPKTKKTKPTAEEQLINSLLKNNKPEQLLTTTGKEPSLEPLHQRIKKILGIIKDKPIKATEMLYLIMYDIESNKVRNRIARYLLRKGCIRIQKSVFLLRTAAKTAEQIHTTLKEVNSYYENDDSLLLVPVNTLNMKSMKIIGRQLNIDLIIDKPSTLFI